MYQQISTDGMDHESERNNERYLPPRERPVQMSLERNDTFNRRRTEPSRDNRTTASNRLNSTSDDSVGYNVRVDC